MEKSIVNKISLNNNKINNLSISEKKIQISQLLKEIKIITKCDNINYHWLSIKFGLKETDLISTLTKIQRSKLEDKLIDLCLLYLIQYKKTIK